MSEVYKMYFKVVIDVRANSLLEAEKAAKIYLKTSTALGLVHETIVKEFEPSAIVKARKGMDYSTFLHLEKK